MNEVKNGTVITFPRTETKVGSMDKPQRSKQSGKHVGRAFGRARGPFDSAPALKPKEMRKKYGRGK